MKRKIKMFNFHHHWCVCYITHYHIFVCLLLKTYCFGLHVYKLEMQQMPYI